MIDFIEYIVSELKSKRLSKAHAIDLIGQFSGRCPDAIASSVLHPLLHRNNSELGRQRYSSVFKGDEFFFADHQIKTNGTQGQKVLPGAAFLEMVRAAIEQAIPGCSASAALELRDLVWEKPIAASENKEVGLALVAEGDETRFEVHSYQGDEQVVHCRGRAILHPHPSPPKLDLQLLNNDMQRSRLDSSSLYASFASMGMLYGAAFQSVTSIHRGAGQALAHLHLPQPIAKGSARYFLHPSIIDGAFQGCIGLADDLSSAAARPRLPYALESLRIFSPSTAEMFAWLRYAPGSHAEDDVVRVDIDLCDEHGNVCQQFRNFAYRVLQPRKTSELSSQPDRLHELTSLLPVWNPIPSTIQHPIASKAEKILLLGSDAAHLEWVQAACRTTSEIAILPLPSVDSLEDALGRESFDELLWIAPDVDHRDGQPSCHDVGIIDAQAAGVLTLFRVVKALLRLGYGDRELHWTLITGRTQNATQGTRIQPTHAAVFGLIGSLAKEYPQWRLRLLDVESLASVSATECFSAQADENGDGLAYRNGQWLRQELSPVPLSPGLDPVPYRQNGVYVILGGAGGLGEAWTRYMVEHYRARVVWIGRRPSDESIEARIKSVALLGNSPFYLQADAANFDELERARLEILSRYHTIHGVVHSAAVLHDRTVAGMDESQFTAGLSPKIDATANMDRVFGSLDLDFMLFFSSIVSFVKSPGQSNYAAGCTFKDSFAHSLRQRRAYPIKTMNWGYWGNVGGAADDFHNANMARLGIGSIEADEGMACLKVLLASPQSQMAVIRMNGNQPIPYVRVCDSPIHATSISTSTASRRQTELAEEKDAAQHPVAGETDVAAQRQIRQGAATSFQDESSGSPVALPMPGDQPDSNEASLREKAISHFQKLLASTLKMRPEQIDPRRPLSDYGLDSILVGQLTFKLRKAFSGVNATLLFEVKNIEGLAGYFLENKKQEMIALLSPQLAQPGAGLLVSQEPKTPSLAVEDARLISTKPSAVRPSKWSQPVAPPQSLGIEPRAGAEGKPITEVAVIGLSGRYPQSKNLKEFWKNLCNGVNCITEIPRDRWKWEEYYDAEKGKRGKIYTRWGGFLEGIDQFDPLFFKISPAEARRMDPQERIFLECCYHAVEDAGYTPENLSKEDKVGVFVGVMNSRYAAQPAHFSIANRVSYLYNFQGPSLAVDTACSSSLTAIHLALESIYREESECALVGGVNLIIDPVHYFQLTEMTMLSRGNACKAFGEADGVVDAEGVGVVVLKPLHVAQRDGDHIYGVIRGSAINAGGRTNGYTVPNPHAQSRLISAALKRANITAQHLSYIEAHGTGTPLGDPIEIAGLTQAFGSNGGKTQYCSIGSLKSNIGHCESAAGIAGLTKVLLQLQHKKLVPSIHSERPNPEIDFAQTPFRVQRRLDDWKRPWLEKDGQQQEIPRLAGVSSFGAGGANAHIVVQEYLPPAGDEISATTAFDTPHAVVLSARDSAQLMQKVSDLLSFVHDQQSSVPAGTGLGIHLASLAYTLQVGREAMEERLGLVVSSVDQLTQRLAACLANGFEIDDVYRGQVKRGHEGLALFNTDADLRETVDKWIANRKLSKLLELWTRGLDLDWSKLYTGSRPRRISLPVYPFARESYWTVPQESDKRTHGAGAGILHPLLHRNISDFSGQRYSATLTGEEFFLDDHQVKAAGHPSQRLLPAVIYLEMARAATEHACAERPDSTVLELRNVAWIAPLVVSQRTEVRIGLWARDGDEFDFEISSLDGNQDTINCQGLACWSRQQQAAPLNVGQLQAEMNLTPLQHENVYSQWAGMGVLYGPAFQALTALHRGAGQVLAELRLPITGDQSGDFVLHPSLLDGALQAVVGLIEEPSGLAGMPPVPFALESLRLLARPEAEMLAWVRYARDAQPGDTTAKLDIDLCDGSGNVCIQLRGLSSRAARQDRPAAPPQSDSRGTLLAFPVWEAAPFKDVPVAGAAALTEHHILVCGLAEGTFESLPSFLPESEVLYLPVDEDENPAENYTRIALAAFRRLQTVLQRKPQGKVLIQIVAGSQGQQALTGGLWGMLSTATLENPQLIGQMILVPIELSTQDLSETLRAEMSNPTNRQVRYINQRRELLRWREQQVLVDGPVSAFHDRGVYLVTGGLGGVGIVFAKEILRQAPHAKVVLAGRSQLSAEKQSMLHSFAAAGQLSYVQVDVGDRANVEQLVSHIGTTHGPLNGILHSAGVVEDNFFLKKQGDEFKRVLAPKVMGVYNLDQATKDLDLEFFILFSSISGVAGHIGQADYAAANGFMDQFAAYRGQLVAQGQRRGATRSIDWGAWEDGGMGVDLSSRALLGETTGVEPMQSATGIQALNLCLALPHHQLLVAEGELIRLRSALMAETATSPQPQPEFTVALDEPNAEALLAKTQDHLRQELAQLLQLAPHKIDPTAPLENYGIDSILAMRLTSKLEKTFGSLSKTLFFEYQTIAQLAGYLVKAYPALLLEKLGSRAPERTVTSSVAVKERKQPHTPARPANHLPPHRIQDKEEIAIVGIAGRYPQAQNLAEFWKNLQNGRDCITEVPLERWDHSLFFDPTPNKPGKSYCKWGGFLADVDKFDPLLFNISPREAALIDPQERLFLQTAWETIEDAGYSRAEIAASRVGVYVGVMWGHYELYGVNAMARGEAIPNSSYASIANRVSYFFDFHGPSISIDTMCSSSLTAIHLACDELRSGGIDAAIAGGVNLSLHPSKYLSLSQGKFGASDGRCRSFGAGGDGYVPGEGVGAVLLKPLQKALRDGDQIYAVIKSSSLNHGGKTNGYTVPNPVAQGDLIRDAFRKANIDPQTLGCIEAHGTGTALGDPIEIRGLASAFEGSTTERQACSIGSVKSNIGHLESAAGIAAVTKAILQIRNKQLVPTLHANQPNPNIDFAASPFRIQTELAAWSHTAPHPRRAGVSSFGAGGSNAHLVLEEYCDLRDRTQSSSPEIFVLSARNWSALRFYAQRFADFLQDAPAATLADIAYTSQVGRTPMEARLAVIASTVDQLKERLQQWIDRRSDPANGLEVSPPESAFVVCGNVSEAPQIPEGLLTGKAGEAFITDLLHNRDLEKVAMLWVSGVKIDWSALHRTRTPLRVSLPTYPFAKERCWIASDAHEQLALPDQAKLGHAPVIAPPEPRERTYYYPEWTPQPIAASSNHRFSHGPTLILDASEELFLAFQADAQTQGHNEALILVKPGDAFQEIRANVFEIDPLREEHFHQLVACLEARAILPGLVLHNSAEPTNLEVEQHVTQQLNRGVYTLLYLSKALLKGAQQRPVSFLSLFSASGEAPAPLTSALSAFLRTMVLENPRYRAKVVELPGGLGVTGDLTLSDKLRLIHDEMQKQAWNAPEIRYLANHADHQRELKRYCRQLVQRTPQAAPSSALPFRQGGVYLITGGIGGLGLIFAEYLASRFQARLVLVGRSASSPAQLQKLARLQSMGAETLALQADVSNLEDMQRIVLEAKHRFATLHGILHAAGVKQDSLILNKTRAEMDAVIAPKVYGAINLDRAASSEDLDFFILFSSVAGVLGSPGQCDYAYGNSFLNSFAEMRENLRKAGSRSGRTLSISWPLWQDGGMKISAADIELLEQQTGLVPLPEEEGLKYWEDFLCSDQTRAIALYGIPSRISASLTRISADLNHDALAPRPPADAAVLLAKTESYLKQVVGAEINLAPDRIGSADRLESFGIDSIMIHRMTATLERDLGTLPKTLFYQYESVRDLAQFLVRDSTDAVARLFASDASPHVEPVAMPLEPAGQPTPEPASVPHDKGNPEPIAIIGIHARYPGSDNLDQYWDNLKHGRDLVGLVPADRWDFEKYYHPDPAMAADGKIYCKWGGFLEDHDKFDPDFFRIAHEEAKAIDPQERLFLQSVWSAIEDAGYTRASIKERCPKAKSADVGVFVGVTTNSYHLWAAEERTAGTQVCPSALPWSIANRVSYFFDFNGPSLPVDTACSSSSVAVHLACESLRNRECQMAIAGGVNLYLHPSKYQSLCQRRMLSLDGKCHSYGAGDDGFVPGEGVGSLVLKPLSKAKEHGDHIYAVIAASAFDHGGRSNGYTAPNPNSLANLIRSTLERASVHPETIGWVEGHGTGTQLGDSLEVAALSQVFQARSAKKQFCPIGSVKSNIGHSESAAGMAGIAKVMLQMKHRQLAPSIHSDCQNTQIEFPNSPFYLQHELSEWKASPDHRRRALINSFGAGGVNACLLIEEYEEPELPRGVPESVPALFVLSARNEHRLREQVDRVLAHLRARPGTNLADLCYTLQVGREAMDVRMAVVTSRCEHLVEQLDQWRRVGSSADVLQGSVSPQNNPAKLPLASGQSLAGIAALWVAGGNFDWLALYPEARPRRIPLPAYSFARDRYWISNAFSRDPQTPGASQLHPLISFNSSTLREVSFTSTLSDTAFYATDHTVKGESLFPGSGFLEMACIAGNLAAEHRIRQIADVVWNRPLIFKGGPQTVRTALKYEGKAISYAISSLDDENESVQHCEGRLAFNGGWHPPADAEHSLPIEKLKSSCAHREDGNDFYHRLAAIGLNYGPSFRVIQELYTGDSFALAKLKIPQERKSGFEQFILHPSIIDGALQTVGALVGGLESLTPHLPFALDAMDILHPLRQTVYAHATFAGSAEPRRQGIRKFNIRLFNESGDLLIAFRNLFARPIPAANSPTPGQPSAIVPVSGAR